MQTQLAFHFFWQLLGSFLQGIVECILVVAVQQDHLFFFVLFSFLFLSGALSFDFGRVLLPRMRMPRSCCCECRRNVLSGRLKIAIVLMEFRGRLGGSSTHTVATGSTAWIVW